jgi:hypothetical protein
VPPHRWQAANAARQLTTYQMNDGVDEVRRTICDVGTIVKDFWLSQFPMGVSRVEDDRYARPSIHEVVQ